MLDNIGKEHIYETAKALKSRFKMEYEIKDEFLFISVSKEGYGKIARYLRENGFERLLTVSAVDWLEEGEFEVYFIVHNHAKNVYAKISTRIPRKNSKIQSLSSLWENSAIHEREVHELFGEIFSGETALKPLFLEGWKGPPPFRKDFNWRKYVEETYDIGGEGG